MSVREENLHFDTLKVKAGYDPKQHNNAVSVPIYETPQMVVLELKSEGIVCASPGDYSGFGDEQFW